MQRREALRLLAAAAALPLLTPEAFSLFQAAREQLPEVAALRTLDPRQNAMVTTISEIIIPQTDTPGAKAVRVNEFIDLILTDWYDNQERSVFLAGLEEVNVHSRKLFGKDLTDCAANQQVEVVTALDEELSAARAAALPGSGHQGGAPILKDNFFDMMKHLTLVGYFTSQAGFEQQLHQQIISPTHSGCAPTNDSTSTSN